MVDPKTGEEVKDPPANDELPDAAKKILEAVQKKLEAKDPPESPDPQPKDARQQAQEWREAKKKEMGWTDQQLDSYQRDIAAANAPLVKDNSLLKVRTAHKDYAQLEKAFIAEIDRYEKNGRVIDSVLAEELFYMVKGKELSAGRYKPEAPSSQPPAKSQGPRDIRPSRIAPSYNPSDPGTGGAVEKGEVGSLSEDEKAALDFMDKAASQVGMSVSEEDYIAGREAKRRGIREIAPRAVKPLDIDLRTANSADRDLANLWNRSSAGRR